MWRWGVPQADQRGLRDEATFVPEQFRGRGYGGKLCGAILQSAKDDQFKLMRLDTADFLTEAIAMYQSFGFRKCAPYIEYPDYIRPHIVFMERPLADT